jgi:hypothetical protein
MHLQIKKDDIIYENHLDQDIFYKKIQLLTI